MAENDIRDSKIIHKGIKQNTVISWPHTDIDKTIDQNYFKGIGIVDCKSTWKPNCVIRLIAGNKAKKYDTVILFDYDGVLQQKWGLPKDNYSIVIVDKERICELSIKGKCRIRKLKRLYSL